MEKSPKKNPFLMILMLGVIIVLLVGVIFVQSQATGLQSQVTGLQSQVTGPQSQLADLKTQNSGLQSQVTGLQSQLADLKTQNSGLQSQVTGLLTQNSGLQSQLADLKTQNSGLQSQVTDLKIQVKQAHLEVGGKADTYEAKFHDLLQEHDFLLIATIHRSLDSHAAFNASYAGLLINIQEVADEIATVYGQNSSIQFKALWTTKIDNFVRYTNTINSGDKVTANSQLATTMAAYEDTSAAFWSTLNPNINKTIIKQIVTDHVNNVKAAVDYWGAGDYNRYFSKLHDSYIQMGVFADYIVEAVVLQHPELFYP